MYLDYPQWQYSWIWSIPNVIDVILNSVINDFPHIEVPVLYIYLIFYHLLRNMIYRVEINL
jgi:hypothetical protein